MKWTRKETAKFFFSTFSTSAKTETLVRNKQKKRWNYVLTSIAHLKSLKLKWVFAVENLRNDINRIKSADFRLFRRLSWISKAFAFNLKFNIAKHSYRELCNINFIFNWAYEKFSWKSHRVKVSCTKRIICDLLFPSACRVRLINIRVISVSGMLLPYQTNRRRCQLRHYFIFCEPWPETLGKFSLFFKTSSKISWH